MTAMPPLLRGRRRRMMALLVLTALTHTGFAVGSGLLVGALLSDVGAAGAAIATDLALLGGCVAGLGATRYAERVLAERLGQDYVQQLRRGLLQHAMTSRSVPSLGITIARSTNDLASVRNWVSLGIAPLVAAVPLVCGSLALLWGIDWRLGLGVTVPLGLLVAVLAALAGPAYRRARTLRRRRGSLAALVADTVTAADAIVAAGGVERELRAVTRSGDQVVTAAVDRARTTGLLRSAALVAPLLGSAAAAGLGALAVVDAATVATALTVVGVLAGPVGDLGRVVEYRQNHQAARRIIAPLLADTTVAGTARTAAPDRSAADDAADDLTVPTRVVVAGGLLDGLGLPPLAASPGDRVLVRLGTEAETRRLFRALVAPPGGDALRVRVGGLELAGCDDRTRRRLVGLAVRDDRLERGTVARAVRYRRPDVEQVAASRALAEVGLAERVDSLPKGERTVLRRGGEPLDREESARLRLARAVLGTPPLLLLDHLDADLGPDGTAALRALLDDYPGVVVFASHHPHLVASGWRPWSRP